MIYSLESNQIRERGSSAGKEQIRKQIRSYTVRWMLA